MIEERKMKKTGNCDIAEVIIVNYVFDGLYL